MDVQCHRNSDAEIISKDPPSNGKGGENIESPTPDSSTPDIASAKEGFQSVESEKQKHSKIQTLKRLVAGKTKSKNEENNEKEESPSKIREKTRSPRELRKSLSRVFSVSSSSLSRVWSSFSATKIHGEGESGSGSSKTLGRMFGKKGNPDNEDKPSTFDPEEKTHTLGRRFSATFRSAFGRSKET